MRSAGKWAAFVVSLAFSVYVMVALVVETVQTGKIPDLTARIVELGLAGLFGYIANGHGHARNNDGEGDTEQEAGRVRKPRRSKRRT